MAQLVPTALPDSLRKVLGDFLAANTQEFFTFRLLGAGTHRMPVQTGAGVQAVPYFASRLISGVTKIRPPEGGAQVALIYSTRTEDKMVNGQLTAVDVPEGIAFTRENHSQVTVRRTDEEKLIRLLFSDECRNSLNPARNTSVEPVYELVEPQKTAKEQAEFARKMDKALLKVGEATDSELAIACERLELPVNTDENLNYTTLRQKATEDPQLVLDALSGEYDKNAALVRDLLAADVVEFDATTRQFIVNPARKNLLFVPQGQHEPALVNYLMSHADGKRHKPTLVKLLEEKTKKRK